MRVLALSALFLHWGEAYPWRLRAHFINSIYSLFNVWLGILSHPKVLKMRVCVNQALTNYIHKCITKQMTESSQTRRFIALCNRSNSLIYLNCVKFQQYIGNAQSHALIKCLIANYVFI